MDFKLVSDYTPTGDQPEAIESLYRGFESGYKEQTLLGVTGSGKTFSVANVIEKLKKPTLVLAHNKILAAQLCSEFREFFPNNAVEYFVSYYDYYQPEAYVAATDTYIEKDSAINEEIEKLRHSATASLFERDDVIIVASVSCIYGLGNPAEYKKMALSLRGGMEITRDEILQRLVEIQYIRNDINFTRSTFRVRGDVIEVIPANSFDRAIRIEMFGDEIDRITEIDTLTGVILGTRNHVIFFPATHYVVEPDKVEAAVKQIEVELDAQVKYFKDNNKLIEAQRIQERTRYDMEMLKEVGFCSGVENYSRILEFREPGSRPYTLIDYFPDDFLLVVDESHVTMPQVRGMYAGDISRKTNLVEYGFRLPCALDNRPLNFTEFNNLIGKTLYVSATPAPYEIERSSAIVRQEIRPTGLLDPEIVVRGVNNQIDDLYGEILDRVSKRERVLVTTLTKKMSEDLTAYLEKLGVKVRYMHSDIDAMERMEIIRDLRLGVFDVLIGINLLREGLDLPEVSLVAILDADKQGFLRSESALIQTIGRAARHVNGSVIMYGDSITPAMQVAIDETKRRREKQNQFNIDNNITPTGIKKDVRKLIEATSEVGMDDSSKTSRTTKKKRDKKREREEAKKISLEGVSEEDLESIILDLERQMKLHAQALEFELAAEIRDKINELKSQMQ